jgi:transcriptional regulator with XRE-family HTH domain
LRRFKSRNETAEAPHPVDCHVGRRIRLRRAQLRLSQGALAARIGVSFQAVQKYESGSIRISASRLYEISVALAVAPGFFFADYSGGPDAEGSQAAEAGETGPAFDRRETLSLVRGYYGIRDRALQAEILRLIARLGNREAAPETSAKTSPRTSPKTF